MSGRAPAVVTAGVTRTLDQNSLERRADGMDGIDTATLDGRGTRIPFGGLHIGWWPPNNWQPHALLAFHNG